jgi:hypothetical protein
MSFYENSLGLDVLRYGLTDICYYWEYQGIGDYGKPKLKNPIEIKCRWDWSESKGVTTEGDEKAKSTEIHVDRYLPIGSYVQVKRHDWIMADLSYAFQVKGMSANDYQWSDVLRLDQIQPGTVNFKATIGD